MATYYMRADGTAANKGAATSAASAATSMNMSVHNSETFSAGDVIVISDAGGVYRSQMTTPSSGTSGNSISYQADGSPRISGADAVSSWTESVVSPLVEDDLEGGSPDAWWSSTNGEVDTNSKVNGTNSFKVADINENLSKTSGLGGTYYVIQFDFVVDSSSSPLTNHKARFDLAKNHPDYICMWLTWDGANYYLGCNTSTTNNPTTFQISADTIYSIELVVDIDSGSYSFKVDGDEKDSGTPSMSTVVHINVGHDGWNASSFTCYVDDVTIYDTDPGGGASNKWYTTLAGATEAKVVSMDGTKGSVAADVDSLSSEYDWYHDTGANRLYIYSTSDPDTAYTGDGVEAGQRDRALQVGSNDYVDFEDITFSHGNDDGTTFAPLAMTQAGSNYVNFTDCSFLFGAYTGLFIDSDGGTVSGGVVDGFENIGIDLDSGDNMTSTGVTVRNIGNAGQSATGIFIGALTPTAKNCMIDNCTIYECNNLIQIDNALQPIVQDCTLYKSDSIVLWNGVFVVLNVSDAIIRRNYIYGLTGAGVNGIHISEASGTVNAIVYGNVIRGNGVGIFVQNGAAAELYNNTLYANGDNISIEDADTSCTMNNNICSEATDKEVVVAATASGTLDFDNNCYHHSAGGTFLSWKGTDYNFADWKTNSSQDGNSISQDPLFSNAGGVDAEDYDLQATSPCAATGQYTKAGLTYFDGSSIPFNGSAITDYRFLFEPVSTNTFTYSEDISNAAWTKSAQALVDADATASPDGRTTADRLKDDSSEGTAEVYVEQSYDATASQPSTFTFFLKEDGLDFAGIGTALFGGSTSGISYFNLGNGTVAQENANHTAKIEPYINGWYRCEVTITSATTTSGLVRVYVAAGIGDVQVALDGESSIFWWGAQGEDLEVSTTYMPNLSTGTSTRTADNASPMFDYANWSQTEGTWYADVWVSIFDGTQNIFGLHNSRVNTPIYIIGENVLVGDETSTSVVNISGATVDNQYRFVSDFGTGDTMEIGYRYVDGAGVFGWDETPANYDGDFPSDSVFNVAYIIAVPIEVRDLKGWTTRKGKDWAEKTL